MAEPTLEEKLKVWLKISAYSMGAVALILIMLFVAVVVG